MYTVYITLEKDEWSNRQKKKDPNGYKKMKSLFKNKKQITIDKKTYKTPRPAFKYFEKLAQKLHRMGRNYKGVSLYRKSVAIYKGKTLVGLTIDKG